MQWFCLLKKTNLQQWSTSSEMPIFTSCVFCVLSSLKAFDSWAVDGGHFECKVQQMNILAWKFITSKVWNITVWYSGDGNLLKTGMSEGYWGYRRGACS